MATRKDRQARYHQMDRRADGESRTPFERDRDRILYSSAFRRLAGVTQVVHAGEGRLFHNRLTHSLKVAQFGRRVAERLVRTQERSTKRLGVDPDVVESAALAHDLGHPPFGHVGEATLHEEVAKAKVPDGYEGNAQSFRIVTSIATRHKSHRGLNLTRATLDAMLKYPWAYETGGPRNKKWGFYYSEKPVFEWVRSPGGEEGRRSAESEIMDWADDVTYAVHDVEDFYKVGVVPLDRILAGESERDLFLERAAALGMDALRADTLLDELGDLAPADVKVPFEGSVAQRAALNSLGAVLITRYNVAVRIAGGAVVIGDEAKEEVKILKCMMRFYVFDNPALVAQQHGQRRVIRDLFGIFFEAAARGSADRALIPLSHRELVAEVDEKEQEVDDERRERARLVSDVISQMTEHQAIEYHRRLSGAASGSVLDRIVP